MQKFRLLLNSIINKTCNSGYFNLVIAFAVIFATITRMLKITNLSADFKRAIIPWFNKINTFGFVETFSNPTWDYSYIYLYIIYLQTLLFNEFNVIAIKLVSIAFDVLMAFYSYRILRLFMDKKPALLFIAFFLTITTQFLNSAIWGQIDGMMQAFFIMSFYYLLTAKYAKAILFFTFTVAIKTTFVFFLPFLGIYWIVNRFPLRYFLIIPTVYLIAALPSLLVGMPLDQLFYSFQAETNTDMLTKRSSTLAINFFNIHTIIGKIDSSFLKDWVKISVAFTFAILGLFTMAIWKNRNFILQKNNLEKILFWLLTLTITLYLVPFFLPYMHDRYYYFATMTAFIYMTISLRYFNKLTFTAWIPFIVLEISSIMAYIKGFMQNRSEAFGIWALIMEVHAKYIIVPLLIVGLWLLLRDFNYLLKNNANIAENKS